MTKFRNYGEKNEREASEGGFQKLLVSWSVFQTREIGRRREGHQASQGFTIKKQLTKNNFIKNEGLIKYT